MNRVYMTFLTEEEQKCYSQLKDAKGSALTNGNDDYYASYKLITDKILASNSRIFFNAILRPVIRADASLIPFISKNRTNSDDLKHITFGTYPLKYVTNDSFIIKENCTKTGKRRTIIKNRRFISCEEYSYDSRRFIFVNDMPIEILPLEWEYSEDINALVCKSCLCCCGEKNDNWADNELNPLLLYIYLNYFLFEELLNDYKVSEDNNLKVVDGEEGTLVTYGFKDFMQMNNDGKVICHSMKKPYQLSIPSGTSKLTQSACKPLIIGDNFNLKMDIDIDGSGLKICKDAFNFETFLVNASINSLTVHNKTRSVDANVFKCYKKTIGNITIPCDFELFSNLYLSGNEYVSKNLFENSNFTLTYTSERELVKFINDVNRFFSLIFKSYYLNKEKKEWHRKIDFTYKANVYKFTFDASKCVPDEKLLENKEILSILKVSSFTLKGPIISDELISKLFPNFSVQKEFTVFGQKEDNTKQIEGIKEETGKPKLTKEAEHILDLAREIVSIDYIGLDKENVKTKVKDIVDEYNNSLSKKTEGLSLTTNNGVYTNAVIKLENLRDSLYYNFEKNLDYYDILDLISSMIKKLNNEETNLDYEILKDLDTLNNVLKYSEDEKTKNELITYLKCESQSIVDYLSGKKEIDYKNINEFVKKFRLFLVPILTRVSGDVSKVDVMKQIKDYALDEMNNKTEANTNNYIKLILNEIDKIKKDILELDSSYVFEELDYSSFKTGKEIIDYLNQKYMEYYRVYLELVENKVNEENYENSKVPLSY